MEELQLELWFPCFSLFHKHDMQQSKIYSMTLYIRYKLYTLYILYKYIVWSNSGIRLRGVGLMNILEIWDFLKIQDRTFIFRGWHFWLMNKISPTNDIANIFRILIWVPMKFSIVTSIHDYNVMLIPSVV